MKKKYRTEIYRKLIHISSLAIPMSFRFIVSRTVMLRVLIPLTLVVFVIEIIRLENKSLKRIFYRLFGIMLRRHEINNYTGASYLMVSAIFCISFFPADIAFLALSSLAIGDTFAAIIGMMYGKRKIRGSKKSLEGSLACFVTTCAYALMFGAHPMIAIVGGISTTIAETSPIPIDDNIKIPIISAVAMTAAQLFIF